MPRAGEPVAVLTMVHDELHAQIISIVMQYAASRRADKAWKGKMIGALGDRNEKGEDTPSVCLKPSYFEWRKVRLPADREDSGPIAMSMFYDQSKRESSATWKEAN